MSLAVPTQFLDAVSSVASAGKGAGQLLREAIGVADHAAEMTSAKGRRLRRAATSGRRATRRSGIPRRLLILAALGGTAWAITSGKGRFQELSRWVQDKRSGTTEGPVEQHERNGTMTSHNTDEIKGRVKEAIGAVTGDDELKSDGKRDQKAASAKKAVDTAKDKVDDGIDAVKEAVSRN